MSGRTRVTLADGRRVTGFRKTLRINRRSAPCDAPELRFTFLLPPHLAFATRAGEYGAVTVEPDGLAIVRGKERTWMLTKAGEFLKSIAGETAVLDPISAVLFCPDSMAPNFGARAKPGYTRSYDITVACGTVRLAGPGHEPIVIE